MIKKALLLLLAAVWTLGSWWYYTCVIKGFCRTTDTFISITDLTKETSATVATITSTPITADITIDKNNTQLSTTDFIDQDNDAISDDDERNLGTDPKSDDSDSDGMKDNEEVGRDLHNPIDSDGDGIIDALDNDDDNDSLLSIDEIKYATNPLSADSDKDGIADGIEIGSNLKKPLDTDNDGIIDALDADDDNDGILTILESTFSSDPLSKDSDGDGVSDKDEVGDNLDQPIDTDGDGIIDIVDATNDTRPTKKAMIEQESEVQPPPNEQQASAKDEVTINTIESPSNDSANHVDIPIQKSRLYFPFRSANPRLSRAAKEYFEEVSQWLNQNPNHTVLLTGHTDSVGKATINHSLGIQRASEIKELMVQLGAKSAQINVTSMGETQPLASNKTQTGRHKNRRVELIPAIKE